VGRIIQTWVFDDGVRGSNLPFFIAWTLSAGVGVFFPRLRLMLDGIATGLLAWAVAGRIGRALTLSSKAWDVFLRRPLYVVAVLLGIPLDKPLSFSSPQSFLFIPLRAEECSEPLIVLVASAFISWGLVVYALWYGVRRAVGVYSWASGR